MLILLVISKLLRLIGMISKSRRKCLLKGCKELAMFGIIEAEHCELHRLKDEENLSERTCKRCQLPNILSINNLCEYCQPQDFVSNHLVKQRFIQKYLEESGIVFDQIDKRIEKGECGKERPDFVLDCGTHIVILECDEEGHARSECSRYCHCPLDANGKKIYHCRCDVGRMHDITQAYGGLPVYFIRFNPDHYKSDKAKVSQSKRLEILLKWIGKLQELKDHEALLSVVYLYYDHHHISKLEVLTLFEK